MDEDYKYSNYISACRICLITPTISEETVDLFIHQDELLPAFVISEISKVQISSDDDLPKKICMNCWKRIHDCYLLIEQIIASDSFLRGIQEIESPSAEILIKTELFTEEHNFTFIDANVENIIDDTKVDVKQVNLIKKEKKTQTVPKCCMCQFYCTTHKELRSHVDAIHLSSLPTLKLQDYMKPFECQYCLKRFASKQTLSGHFRRPYLEKNHQCADCGLTFRHRSSLKEHEQNHSTVRSYVCDICKKNFICKKNIRRHMNIHDPSKMMICDFCHKGFFEKKHLEHHMKMHKNIREFKCKECDKKFVNKTFLRLHTRTHSGERPYKCDMCDKSYVHGTDLKRHKLMHSGIRPFKCSYCDRTFIQRSNMKVHERTHTGETPFSCNICGDKFKFHAHWKQHEKKHHETTMYLC